MSPCKLSRENVTLLGRIKAMKTDVVTLSQKQLNRLDIINKAIAGFLTVSEAALALGLSERQIKRLKKEVKDSGAAAIIHKNSIKKPSNAINDEIIKKILFLKSSHPYIEANFSHFKDLLAEKGIQISYSALYRILTSYGFKSPKTRRRFKPHRRRSRKKQAGLLLQIDATPFSWFSGKAKYALHGAIDDATGQITALYLCKNECLLGYFEMLRRVVDKFGLPQSLYSDRHSIFRSPTADKVSIEDQLAGISSNDTQFGRALRELNINIIYARSPQAKGRIERLWGTLQSRLPIEFKLRNIDSVDKANEFLLEYPDMFNTRFAVAPQDVQSCFRPLPDGLNTDYCLCSKESRILDYGGVFSYYNKSFQVSESNISNLLPPKAKILVLTSPTFGIKAQYKNYIFDVVRHVKPRKASAKDIVSKQPRKPNIPSPDHPWRHYDKDVQAILAKLSQEGYV